MDVETTRAIEALAQAVRNLDARLRDVANSRPKLQEWQAPTLLNSWVNGGAGFSIAGYWKDPHGLVHLRGFVNSGASGSLAFVLPTNYQPRYSLLVRAYDDAVVEILDSGSVSISWAGTSNTVLDGIVFRAFQ